MAIVVQLILILFVPVVINGQRSSKFDTDVLILGGGIAGVAAAKTLHDHGFTNFMIIEAQSELGGRIRTVEIQSGIKLNAGASWIHGYHDNHPLVKIANAENCGGLKGDISDFESITVRDSRGNSITNRLHHDDYNQAKDQITKVSNERRKSASQDMSVREAFIKYSTWEPTTQADKWVEWYNFDYEYGELPENTSLFASLPLPTYDYTDDNYFITDKEGFSKIVRCLTREFLSGGMNDSRLHLNTKVTKIEIDNKSVCVVADHGEKDYMFCGKYGILTFSIGVLQNLEKAGIEFVPPLLPEKIEAINQLHMAHYLHVPIQFDSKFWEDVEFIGYVDESDGRYLPLFAVLTEIRDAHILFATLTGESADRVASQSLQKTKKDILAVINNVYGIKLNLSNILNILVPDWKTNSLFYGSYSNVPANTTNDTFETLREPINGRLYFSGEATCQNYQGFVHGGYLSGVHAAVEVSSQISSTCLPMHSWQCM